MSTKSNILTTLKLQNGFEGLKQATFASSFTTFLRQGKSFLTNAFFQYFTAPVAALAFIFDIIFAWRLYYLERNQFTLSNAIITTLTGLALIAAAIGLTIGASLFAMIAPILFAASIGLTTVYKTGVGFYMLYKASDHQSFFNESAAYQRLAQEAFIEAAFNAIATGITIALMLVAAPVAQIVLTSIGLATTLSALIFSLIKSFRLASASEQVEHHQLDLYTTAIISTSLDIKPTNHLSLTDINFNLPMNTLAKTAQNVSNEIQALHRIHPHPG